MLDAALEPGKPVVLTVHRLPGERLEVCGDPKHCAIYERMFDAYSHEVR